MKKSAFFLLVLFHFGYSCPQHLDLGIEVSADSISVYTRGSTLQPLPKDSLPYVLRVIKDEIRPRWDNKFHRYIYVSFLHKLPLAQYKSLVNKLINQVDFNIMTKKELKIGHSKSYRVWKREGQIYKVFQVDFDWSFCSYDDEYEIDQLIEKKDVKAKFLFKGSLDEVLEFELNTKKSVGL